MILCSVVNNDTKQYHNFSHIGTTNCHGNSPWKLGISRETRHLKEIMSSLVSQTFDFFHCSQ